MQILSSLLLVAALSGCASRTFLPSVVPTFPAAMHDYAPATALVRLALPVKRSDGWVPRLWIKGSEARRSARIDKDVLQLGPPFYTATHELKAGTKGPITVEFPAREPSGCAAVVRVNVPDFARRFGAGRSQTIAIYGCFQPFGAGIDPETVGEKVSRVIPLLETGNKRVDAAQQAGEPAAPYHGLCPREKLRYPNMVVRELFRQMICDPHREFRVETRSGEEKKGSLWLAPTTLVLGTGDQIYTDSGYHDLDEFGVGHPLSAWTIERRPVPRWTMPPLAPSSPSPRVAGFERLLHRSYLHHGSFEFEQVFRVCPRVSTWDDHEIRDGWGSHGDEDRYEDCFMAAREAFVAHQIATGPLPTQDPSWRQRQDFDQMLDWGGLPIYILDTRSRRGPGEEYPVLSKDQEQAFMAWLDDLKSDSTYVLVSPLPLTVGNAEGSSLAGVAVPELLDDLQDGWHSPTNAGQLERLLQAMVRARIDRGVKPIIVSGDVHQSALIRIWYHETGAIRLQRFRGAIMGAWDKTSPSWKPAWDWYKGARLLGVEMVVSGLSSGTFDGSAFAASKALKRVAAMIDPEIVNVKIRGQERFVGLKTTLDHQVVGPNFGAIERDPEGAITLHFVAYSYDRETVVFRSARVDWEQRWDTSGARPQRPQAIEDSFLIEVPRTGDQDPIR